MTLHNVLRRVRSWASGQADDGRAAIAAGLAGPGAGQQLLAQARVHRLVAAELTRVMQEKLTEREHLRRQLSQHPDISELRAAWLQLRIGELDRLITQQVASVDWHLHESHRLEHGTG